MKDLTQDSVVRNIIAMAAPIAAGMLFQTLYFLVDLYFVAGSATRRSPASAPPATCSSS